MSLHSFATILPEDQDNTFHINNGRGPPNKFGNGGGFSGLSDRIPVHEVLQFIYDIPLDLAFIQPYLGNDIIDV